MKKIFVLFIISILINSCATFNDVKEEEFTESIGLAVAYSRQGNFSEAITKLELLLESDLAASASPKALAICHYYLGMNYMEVRNIELALQSFEKAKLFYTENNVDSPVLGRDIYEQLGRATGVKGNLNQARRYLRRSIEISHEIEDEPMYLFRVELLYLIAQSYHDEKKDQISLEIIEELFEELQDQSISSFQLAEIHMLASKNHYYLGNYNSSSDSSQRAIEAYKKEADRNAHKLAFAHYYRGIAMVADNRLIDSIDDLKAALNIYEKLPNSDVTYMAICAFNLGSYNERLAKYELAGEYYGKAAFYYERGLQVAQENFRLQQNNFTQRSIEDLRWRFNDARRSQNRVYQIIRPQIFNLEISNNNIGERELNRGAKAFWYYKFKNLLDLPYSISYEQDLAIMDALFQHIPDSDNQEYNSLSISSYFRNNDPLILKASIKQINETDVLHITTNIALNYQNRNYDYGKLNARTGNVEIYIALSDDGNMSYFENNRHLEIVDSELEISRSQDIFAVLDNARRALIDKSLSNDLAFYEHVEKVYSTEGIAAAIKLQAAEYLLRYHILYNNSVAAQILFKDIQQLYEDNVFNLSPHLRGHINEGLGRELRMLDD